MSMEKNKNILDNVKSSLKILEDDVSFLRDFDGSLSSETSNFLKRMNSKYASAIEKIVQEDENGYSNLENISVSVNEMRLQQYQKATKSMLKMTKKELKNAFWFRDHFSLSQRINDIEKIIFRIDSSLTSKESIEIKKTINDYRNQINALSEIQNSFRRERYRSRLGISLKVVLWGVPILIGVWISNKFDNSTIFVFMVIIIFFALLSYLLVGNKRFEELIGKNKKLLVISFSFLVLIAFLWQISFYYYKISLESMIGNLGISLGILVVSASIMEEMAREYPKRNFVTVISAVNKNYSPENKIVITYSLENKRSGVITEVGVNIFAPGLTIFFKEKYILYKSISSKSTKNGEIKLLEVPLEVASGEYIVELNWSFYVGSEKYKKTDKIKINVVT